MMLTTNNAWKMLVLVKIGKVKSSLK